MAQATDSGTIIAALQSDRRKTPETRAYRYMTPDEARDLQYGQHIYLLLRGGRVGQVKVNGEPKTWKRDASRLEVPVKYGMYEYATLYPEWYFTGDGGASQSQRMSTGAAYAVIPVESV